MSLTSPSSNFFKNQTLFGYSVSFCDDTVSELPISGVSDQSNSISLNWREELRDLTIDIYNENCSQGWDGYNALPIKKDAVTKAIKFIELLPDSIMMPELAPENSGEIGFEWSKSDDLILSLVVKQNRIIYAGVLGRGTKRYGEEPFSSIFPLQIKRILLENFSKE